MVRVSCKGGPVGIRFEGQDWRLMGQIKPKELLRDLLPPRSHLRWNQDRRAWEVARSQLLPLVRELAEWFGVVTVDEVRTVIGDSCDVRCREAQGDDCNCRCLGLYHGEGMPRVGWVLVGETTLQQRPVRMHVRWQVRRQDLADGRPPYRQGTRRR
jgi:hypothetical protein